MRECQGKRLYINANRYTWPDPIASQEQHDKFTGADIESMDDLQRWQEIKKLEYTLIWLEDDKILFIDASVHPAVIITRIAWALDRIKKLKGAAA